jgi:hypothetical protein
MSYEGNYLRARACVHACAGMPDPAAEIAKLRDAISLALTTPGMIRGRDALEAAASGHTTIHTPADPVGLIATLQKQVKQLREALEEKEKLRAAAVARCDELLKALEQSTSTSERLLAERDALKYANDVVQRLQAEIMRTPCAPRGRWDDILPSSL